MKKLCAILNISPLYRKAIFESMDNELGADFFFGDYTNENIALLNPHYLKGFKPHLGNIYYKDKLVWQRGVVRAVFSKWGYKNYLITGNPGIKSNWIVIVIARLLGRKVWLWTHGLRGNESRYSRFVNVLYMRLATGLLFYSSRGAHLASQAGIPDKKINVVYNSLDYNRQKALRGTVGGTDFLRNYFGNDNHYVIFVGRLTKTKKIDMMIRALQDLVCNIVIVGDGPERDNLMTIVSQLEMDDRVWFYGGCYDEQMLAQLIYHASVLISPGNIGLSSIHAMAYGTIPITNDNLDAQMPEVEAVIELEHELSRNLLFDDKNEESMTELVRGLLPFVSINRDEIREKCYSVVESHWNVDYQISVMNKLFGI